MRRILLLLPLAALAGCGLENDGPMTEQPRHLPAFTRVQTDSSVDLRLRAGGPQRVRVRAGEKVIDDVHTVVRDGTLVVTFEHHSTFGGPDHAEVLATVPELTAVASTGSGDIEVAGVRADAFAVRSDGSGDIEAAGSARRLTVALDGSGDAKLARLAAREATVAVGGSGDADVRAAARLAVRIDGSGDVHYRGEPVVSSDVDGSGDLKRAD